MALTLILSAVFIASIILMLYSAVALIQKKALFSSAPKDVQAAIIERKEERFRGARALGWALLIVSMLGIAFAFLFGAYNGIQNKFTLWQFFARFLLMLYIYKAFDIICFDWLLLTKSRFFQHYYPEIEGCEGLKKYGFNLKSQIAKLIAFPFVSLLAAWICKLF
jgi:hypothetical protein